MKNDDKKQTRENTLGEGAVFKFFPESAKNLVY